MKKEKIQSYSARVTQANRTELLVIMYEIIQEELTAALDCFEESDMEGFDIALKNGQKFLGELMGTLNYEYVISYQLMSLYKFVNKTIIEGRIRQQIDHLVECIGIIENIKKGFEEIVKEDTSGPLMENVQKLYAGLTYGKASLNEISVNVNDGKRGLYA
ncbi:MAG: flagellar protein FliS [Lachnospiraceae bacterium]|nr:flagellar protein FliS [Lachnospiraceae bacterium]